MAETPSHEGALVLRKEDGVAYLTVNRPEARNALTPELSQGIVNLLESLRGDSEVRVVLLQAKGSSFIAGGDIKAFATTLDRSPEARAEDMSQRAARAGALCAAMNTLPQPVLVAARGPAVGVGASIVLAADLAIASETLRLRLSHVTLGINPDGAATHFLPRLAGLKRAYEFAMLGEPITAEDARMIGLVNWVTPDAELEERAKGLARRLAESSATALTQIKRLLGTSSVYSLQAQVGAEMESMGICAASSDYVEGLRAALEKRAPNFWPR